MSAATATLSSKYQISVPKEIREALNLKPGQKLVFLNTGSGVRLIPEIQPKDLFGLLKDTRGKNSGPVNLENYRDRSARREDSFPTRNKSDKTSKVNAGA